MPKGSPCSIPTWSSPPRHRLLTNKEMVARKGGDDPHLLLLSICRTSGPSRWTRQHRHLETVALVVEGMDRSNAVRGIRCGASDNIIMLWAEADINRRVLVVLTIPVDFVARKGISRAIATRLAWLTIPVGVVARRDTLRMTAPDQTCGGVVATIEETVGVGHKAITPRISKDGSTPRVGIVAKVAITLTSALIRLLICQVDPVTMGRWRIGAGFVIKPRTCRSIAQLSQDRATRCVCHQLRRQRQQRQWGSNKEHWSVCRIRARCQAWRLA